MDRRGFLKLVGLTVAGVSMMPTAVEGQPKEEPRVWGQKALAPSPYELGKLNERRLCLYIKERLNVVPELVYGEINDSRTRQVVTKYLNDVMGYVRDHKGVYDFQVVCDASNNTPDVIDSNKLAVCILYKRNPGINYTKLNAVFG